MCSENEAQIRQSENYSINAHRQSRAKIFCVQVGIAAAGDMNEAEICYALSERLRMKELIADGAEEKRKSSQNPLKAKEKGGLCRL